MMSFRKLKTPGRFLELAGPLLLRREAHNNILLGLAIDLQRHPEKVHRNTHLLVAETDGRPVGAAMLSDVFPILLSGWPAEEMDALVGFIETHGAVARAVLGTETEAWAFAESLRDRRPRTFLRKERDVVVYTLERVAPVSATDGIPRPATHADIEIACRLGTDFFAAIRNPGRDATAVIRPAIDEGRLFLLETKTTVAMAAFVRETPNTKIISMVYTERHARGRGYATALTAHLATLALTEGKQQCVLLADEADASANRVYQKVGFTPSSRMTELALETLPL